MHLLVTRHRKFNLRSSNHYSLTFLLATGELYQFRYLSEAAARDDNGEAEGEDRW